MFKGLGNLGNITSLVGALQDLPEKMKELNAQMQQETVNATSTCGNAAIVMTCVGKVESVVIHKEGLSNEEIQSATVDAANQAGALAKKRYAEAISEMASEMNLNVPGIEGMISSMTGNG